MSYYYPAPNYKSFSEERLKIKQFIHELKHKNLDAYVELMILSKFIIKKAQVGCGT
jgi:hypothetical protein